MHRSEKEIALAEDSDAERDWKVCRNVERACKLINQHKMKSINMNQSIMKFEIEHLTEII